MRQIITCAVVFFLWGAPLVSQEIGNEEIRRRVESYKSDSRGPYKEIRWYCKDGTILPPQERCPEPGGVQRARHKDEVYALSLSNHIFLGQILSTTPFPDFWDADHYYSRLRQYQLEKYLQAIDNGWVLRKAQFYRGAFQAEDEAIWGIDFYRWLLADDRVIRENFFLIRQSLRDIPHLGDDNLTRDIRAVSKVISDQYTPFLDLRVKIHGQPDESDLEKVERFRDRNRQQLDEELLSQFDKLIGDIKTLYTPVNLSSLDKYLVQFPADSRIAKTMAREISYYGSYQSGIDKAAGLSRMLYTVREGMVILGEPKERLAALDLSIALEDLLIRELSGLRINDIREYMEIIPILGRASAGCGYMEIWEWEKLSSQVRMPGGREVPLQTVVDFFDTGRRFTEWGTGMFRAHYRGVTDLYGGFEPLAYGFIDDRVRSSLLLYCGRAVDQLGDRLSTLRPGSNQIMDIPEQHTFRGLNPGYAAGELVVVSGQTDGVVVEREKIYIFDKPPPDLKPVAGIATVTEGNMVSHVQLLARNLGIPNAVLSPQNLEDLKKYSGDVVFYAVSAGGTVILKPFDQIDTEERNLIETRKRSQERIEVPVDKIDLNQRQVVPLSQLASESSGILCGPKAANLGQLKKIFPDHVVDGIVIPFGIFRMHLDQPMPGQEISYWQYLNLLFEKAGQIKLNGGSDEEVESYVLKELDIFKKSIQQISLQEEFLTDLSRSFKSEFGREIGQQPVFLRSDTNMEDLKDFTGAGLNLTKFNVLAYESILQGIRDVWASPYTERSYRWRQQYLLNPENVFPSILIIPSVDVDYSGVMVTRGISNHDENDLTAAFNLGAGGAVDGQAAESYLFIRGGGDILLSPSREPSYIRLPASGGSEKHLAAFDQPILNESNIRSLRVLAEQVRKHLPGAPGIETTGPFDIELGFKDNHLWLFQVRPFVENKNAAASEYLNSLNPEYDKKMMIPITMD